MKIKLEIQDGKMSIECRATLIKAIGKITEEKQVNLKMVDEFE